MKIENQVCTLDQANKIKELGIEQHSLFSFMAYGSEFKGDEKPCFNNYYKADSSSFLWASAFTCAELGIIIPDGFTLSEVTAHIEPHKQWICGRVIAEEEDYDYDFCEFGATEAQARANMLIYLLETDKTTAEICNKRLL